MDSPTTVSASWSEFCDELKDVGLHVLGKYPAKTEDDAGETIQFVTRVLRGALEYQLDGGDRKHPRLLCWDRGTAGAMPAAPSLDNTYYIALIDPHETYRLTFEVSSIDEINVSVHEHMITGRRQMVYGD